MLGQGRGQPLAQRGLNLLLWSLLLLGLWLGLWLGGADPVAAATHTYHERPGQTTYRSQQSLRDRNDLAWQATLFKRYSEGQPQGTYLRLVGFPKVVQVAVGQPLRISTGTGLVWQASPGHDPHTSSLPENVVQYDFEPVLAELRGAIPLELVVPLKQGQARLTVAPFVVEEWCKVRDWQPQP